MQQEKLFKEANERFFGDLTDEEKQVEFIKLKRAILNRNNFSGKNYIMENINTAFDD